MLLNRHILKYIVDHKNVQFNPQISNSISKLIFVFEDFIFQISMNDFALTFQRQFKAWRDNLEG